MTSFATTYNFMDLLKDKGFAPQTDMNSNKVVSFFSELATKLSSKIEQTAIQYDFMDLMRDNGFIPEPVPEPVNDNVHSFGNLVALLENMVGKFDWKVELPVEHHDFMDLLHDKGFVPVYSNDNGLNVRVA